jgi:hypothetical protein
MLEAPVSGAPVSLGLGAAFGLVVDDEFFVADFAGEIAHILDGFFADVDLFADHGFLVD